MALGKFLRSPAFLSPSVKWEQQYALCGDAVTVDCSAVSASQPHFPRKLQPARVESKASSFPWCRLSGAKTELCRGNYQIRKQSLENKGWKGIAFKEAPAPLGFTEPPLADHKFCFFYPCLKVLAKSMRWIIYLRWNLQAVWCDCDSDKNQKGTFYADIWANVIKTINNIHFLYVSCFSSDWFILSSASLHFLQSTAKCNRYYQEKKKTTEAVYQSLSCFNWVSTIANNKMCQCQQLKEDAFTR